MFASYYFMNSNSLPITSCLRCAVFKSSGQFLPDGCTYPVLTGDGSKWNVKECWRVKKSWDEQLLKRAGISKHEVSQRLGELVM